MGQPQITLSRRRILFVGCGNLSFELAFARRHRDLVQRMVVTTYEAFEDFKKSKHSLENKRKLCRLGVIVLHDIDATRLHESTDIGYIINLQHVYFNHPYNGPATTSKLVEDFFESVSKLNHPNAHIHLIRVRGGKYEKKKPKAQRHFDKTSKDYDLNEHYANLYGLGRIHLHGYRLDRKIRFNTDKFPEYTHAKTSHIGASAPIVRGNNSLEYLFVPKLSQEPDYDSEEIASEDDDEVDVGPLTPKKKVGAASVKGPVSASSPKVQDEPHSQGYGSAMRLPLPPAFMAKARIKFRVLKAPASTQQDKGAQEGYASPLPLSLKEDVAKARENTKGIKPVDAKPQVRTSSVTGLPLPSKARIRESCKQARLRRRQQALLRMQQERQASSQPRVTDASSVPLSPQRQLPLPAFCKKRKQVRAKASKRPRSESLLPPKSPEPPKSPRKRGRHQLG